MIKKRIALVLAILMIVSILPAVPGVYAEGQPESAWSLEEKISEEQPVQSAPEEENTEGQPVQSTPEEENTEGQPVQSAPEEENTEGQPVQSAPEEENTEGQPVQSAPEKENTEGQPVQSAPGEKNTEKQPGLATASFEETESEAPDLVQLEGYIAQITQSATDLVSLGKEELDDLIELVRQVEETLDALSGEEKEELGELSRQFENAAVAVRDYQQVLEAMANGTLDQLEQTGRENSWRYQNGQQVKTEETSAAWGMQTLSAGGYTGIDVSHHNDVVDWQAVKDSGIDFAIIRCGYGDDLPYQDDAQWARNVAECERLGIPYGVYLYSYATSADQARNEARHALRLLEGHSPSLPVFIDYEEPRNLVGGTQLLGEMAKIFCDAIQQAGYAAGVYGSLNWWEHYFVAPEFSNESWYHWVAHWGSASCGYGGRYEMWQYASDGAVNGISGRVDMNIWYGDSLDVRPGRAELESATVLPEGVQLKWQEVQGMQTYRLYRRAYGQSGWSILKDVTGTSYLDKTVQSGKHYSYMVKAYKKASSGTIWADYDAEGLSVLYLATPDPATLAITSNGMKISWNKISGATGYRVYRMNEKGEREYLKDIAATTCTDTTVQPGQAVRYTVRAYRKEGGETLWGSYDKTGAGAVYMAAAALQGAEATAQGVQLSWDKIEGAQVYRLYRQEEGQSLKILKDVTETQYLDTTAQSGRRYTYILKAYQKASGKTLWTLYDKDGITLDYLASPKGLTLSSAKKTVQLSWQPVEGVTKYRIYRRTPGGTWSVLKDVTEERYIDAAVLADEQWEYTVRAYRKEGTRTIWSDFEQTGKVVHVKL